MVPQLRQGKALNPNLSFEVLHSSIPVIGPALPPLYALGPSLSPCSCSGRSFSFFSWDCGLMTAVSTLTPTLPSAPQPHLPQLG